jgi:hypothetical protein
LTKLKKFAIIIIEREEKYMNKNNNHKKEVYQDNFIKRFCCSSRNHPQGWRWWKKHNRKLTRNKLKKELDKIEE